MPAPRLHQRDDLRDPLRRESEYENRTGSNDHHDLRLPRQLGEPLERDGEVFPELPAPRPYPIEAHLPFTQVINTVRGARNDVVVEPVLEPLTFPESAGRWFPVLPVEAPLGAIRDEDCGYRFTTHHGDHRQVAASLEDALGLLGLDPGANLGVTPRFDRIGRGHELKA